jgi:NADH:ubiquinone oxidoreductase subunit 4 (subunit M)
MSEALALQGVLWLPLAGMLAIAAVPTDAPGRVRAIAFWVMVLQFLLTAWLYVRFDAAASPENLWNLSLCALSE